MRATIDGTDEQTWFGEWPPRLSDFGFQGAIYHSSLREFGYDLAASLLGEPADWNLARRMWEAGVRFLFLPRSVGTYHVDPAAPAAPWWRQRARDRGALTDDGPGPLPEEVVRTTKRLLDRIPVDFGGGCSEVKAHIVADVIMSNRLRLAVELGVYRGRFLLPLGVAFRSLGSGVAIGVDPYSAEAATQSDDHSLGSEALTAWALAQDWDGLHAAVLGLITAEGLDDWTKVFRETSEEAAHRFSAGEIDLLHVDANHDRDAVKRDFETFRPLVRPGGFIVLDDVTWESVRPIYQELRLTSDVIAERTTLQDDFAIFRT
jgi:hypothetical protein